LWPAEPPPSVQGAAVERIALLGRAHRLFRQAGPLPAAIAIAAAVIIAAAIASLAGKHSHPPTTVNGAFVGHSVVLMPPHLVVKKHNKNGEDWYTADWGVCHVAVKPSPKPHGHALYTVSLPNSSNRLQFVHGYEPPKDLYRALESHPAVNAACLSVLPSSPPTTAPATTAPATTKASTPPTLTLPPGMTVEATGPDGATVAYKVAGRDAQGRTLTPSCSPAPGSVFALGTTTVNCSVTDSGGLTATGSFPVTVQDTTPPTLTLPPDQSVGSSGNGATVTYTATATDIVDGPVTPSCSPASGSFFPNGTTTVNCSATDAHGNTATGSFTVTVSPIG
jgi:hypothetical protein